MENEVQVVELPIGFVARMGMGFLVNVVLSLKGSVITDVLFDSFLIKRLGGSELLTSYLVGKKLDLDFVPYITCEGDVAEKTTKQNFATQTHDGAKVVMRIENEWLTYCVRHLNKTIGC